jgi:hypothetical protein
METFHNIDSVRTRRTKPRSIAFNLGTIITGEYEQQVEASYVQTVEASQVQTLQQKSQHLLILRNIE